MMLFKLCNICLFTRIFFLLSGKNEHRIWCKDETKKHEKYINQFDHAKTDRRTDSDHSAHLRYVQCVICCCKIGA